MKYTHAKDIIAWKHAECPDCEFNTGCPRTIKNIEVCFMEDRSTFKGDVLSYLVKRTIRFLCALDRRERREDQGGQWRAARSRTEAQYNAFLYCADRKEFSVCRRST